eukprot:1137677-Pelagomonas_calceolata.AAC.5
MFVSVSLPGPPSCACTKGVTDGAKEERKWMADLEEYGKKYPKEYEEFKVGKDSVRGKTIRKKM